MNHKNINHLIELIYEAAIDPLKWSDLLNSLAEFVDHIDHQIAQSDGDAELLSVIPGIAAIGDRAPQASISETLKYLTDISTVANDNSYQDIGEINDLLIGHFARAIKIAKRLVDMDEQHEVVLSLLDRLPIALILVDDQAKIIESNALADEILSSGAGLDTHSDHLTATNNNQKKLLKAIAGMSKHDPATTRGQTVLLSHDEASNNLMLFLAPLKHHGMTQKASVAVFIAQRKSQPLTLPSELTDIYGLTEKEVQITGQLVRGLSIKEIAEEFSVSQHTVRSQVKAILRKTDTSRQAELVSLVFNGMGSFVNSIPEIDPGRRQHLLAKARPWQTDHKILQLDGGRNLAFQEYGDPKGEPVIHCHSVLGSRLEQAFNAEDICKQKNVRLIVLDRPGFGSSDPDPDACFAKWPHDLVQLLDFLEIKQCSLTGYAMGGQYALACASEIPERIKRIAIISAGMTPETTEDYEQIVPLYKMNNRLARHVPKVYGLLSSVLVKGVLNDPENFFGQLSEKLDAADQEIMGSDGFKSEMFASLREGFKQGGKASSRDIVQYMHDWGFDLNKITVPVDIWHGDKDHHVPCILSNKFESVLSHKRYFTEPGMGHYMFYTHWEKILTELLP